MEPDYPSAHLRDTYWFAVDAVGHVAIFWTGENGHLPVNSGYQDPSELLERARLPGSPEHPERLDPEESCRYLGVYLYSYGEHYYLMNGSVLAPYICDNAPREPLHVDQLPPGLRSECAEIRFDARFDRAAQFQPLEFVDYNMWYSDHLAYLCGDGKTVRSLPGHESEFADFVREFHEQQPDLASKLIFDYPDE